MGILNEVDSLMAYSVLKHAAEHLEFYYDQNRSLMSHEEAICNFGARAQMLELMDEIHREVMR